MELKQIKKLNLPEYWFLYQQKIANDNDRYFICMFETTNAADNRKKIFKVFKIIDYSYFTMHPWQTQNMEFIGRIETSKIDMKIKLSILLQNRIIS